MKATVIILLVPCAALNIMKIRARGSTVFTSTLFNQWTIDDMQNLSRGFLGESRRLLNRIRNPETRRQDISSFATDMNIITREIFTNAFESPLGQRAEGWLAAQIALTAAVLYGTLPLLGLALKVLGLLSVVSGTYYLLYGMLNLCESVSPFIYPVSKNILKTHGAYSIVRHPIYTGLILLCLGGSFISGSLTRFVLAMALALFLVLFQTASIVISYSNRM